MRSQLIKWYEGQSLDYGFLGPQFWDWAMAILGPVELVYHFFINGVSFWALGGIVATETCP